MNVFLDCGGHFGEGLRSIIQKHNMDKSWSIHTFEPNPAALFVLEKTVKELDLGIKLFRGALLDMNGYCKFSIQLNSTGAGSVDCLMDKGVCADPNSESFRFHDTIVQVPCLDVSDVVRQFDANDTIVMKLDVEGSEFKILRKLIKDGLISRIRHLYIEWHDIYLSSESEQSKNEIMDIIRSCGVHVEVWQ